LAPKEQSKPLNNVEG